MITMKKLWFLIICLLQLVSACKKDNVNNDIPDISQKLISNKWSYREYNVINNTNSEIRTPFTIPDNIIYTFFAGKTLQIYRAADLPIDLTSFPEGTYIPTWMRDTVESTIDRKWDYLPSEQILKTIGEYKSDGITTFPPRDFQKLLHDVTSDSYAYYYRIKNITDSTISLTPVFADNSEYSSKLYILKKK